ncbi:hypothetical protein [Deferribacter desulfuricans]|uniref:hypothetical protein n=1 Tax=Deferribacter desulfuricans TaxID=197162 RepID=UPI0002ECF47C|nr:hypothetical protein [Deferribacter desulfuricans]
MLLKVLQNPEDFKTPEAMLYEINPLLFRYRGYKLPEEKYDFVKINSNIITQVFELLNGENSLDFIPDNINGNNNT